MAVKNIYKIILFASLSLLLNTRAQSQNSALAYGQWYQVAIEENGIYKLTYQDFVDMGFDADLIDPNKIQIYGNAEGVLPEPNNILRPDSLIQNAIYVSGSADGSFDANDYVAFYAVGAHKWSYETFLERFRYYGHPYDDKNYYFITVGEENGLRLGSKINIEETPQKIVTEFIDKQAQEINLVNFVKSGRKWFGESFSDHPEQVFTFNFPNRVTDRNVKYGIYAAARSGSKTNLIINPLGSEEQTMEIPRIQGTYSYAMEAEERKFYQSDEEGVELRITYEGASPSDNAWIDYIEVTAVRELKMHDHQLAFIYDIILNENQIIKFELENANETTMVWEVSDPYQVMNIEEAQLDGNTLNFTLELNDTHQFVAFEEEGLKTPEFIGLVENQNLRGLSPFDYVIIAAPELVSEAQRLVDFHNSRAELRTILVTTEEIYNEFSSGKQDPAAIRNFIRYHYNENKDEDKPKYALMFGDASYDYKDVIPNNSNLVPVFQSINSIKTTDTYNTDDFFGIMGQLDGDASLGEMQVSIGRFPVRNIEEAQVMVDKSINYCINTEDNMGDWRNKVCFIADDEDSNLHFNDSNELADTFMVDHPEFNVNKIFLDSYVQESTANGYRYPDVTAAINQDVKDGTLFFNYTGHGGHLALTDERILQIPDILGFQNTDQLGVWIVASCEFGPFDDPNHTSAGEHLVLNPRGGGVALFTTTRLAYASYNFRLNKKFHEIAFSRNDKGEHFRLGDIIRYAKNESGNQENNLNFVLLGDPALKMVYPSYEIKTTHINDIPVEEFNQDTIKGRQTVKIKGNVLDIDQSLLSDFNGNMKYKIYGKPSIYHTLANDGNSYKADFQVIDQIITEGIARVTDGLFEFEFVVPENISSSYGPGKISYYATSDVQRSKTDANGGFNEFIIGGLDESISNDLQGPIIDIYMDTYTFKNGDPASNTPLLLVELFDENGISSGNLGFGKEIKASLDNELDYYLNDYYVPKDYSYKNGTISYQLDELELGTHTIKVKAWDTFDNSSEKSIDFIVVSQKYLNIYDLMNAPNPVSDYTNISFKHNQSNENQLNVSLNLYDLYGRLIYTINQDVIVTGNTIEPILLDQSNQVFRAIKTGIYSYTIEVENQKGQKVKGQQKMMIVK